MVSNLNDFRRLSPPSIEAMVKRDEQIAELKKQLGHKYLLSKPMPRVK